MKILLTGAFGNLGSLLLHRLLDEGYHVTAFDIKTPINLKISSHYKSKCTPAIDIQWGDIRDEALINKLIEGKDTVIHLAAMIAPFSEINPKLSWDINVNGTTHLLNAIERTTKKPLFVFSSSFAVFGHRQSDLPPRTLADPLFATDHYSKQKIACENLIKEKEANWVILRFGAMIDTRMRHSDKQVMVLGFNLAANNRIEYIHPNDAATAIINSLRTPEAHNKVHLIGGGSHCQTTHLTLFNAITGALGLTFEEKDLGTQELYADWADTTESQRILQYQHSTFEEFRQESYEKFKWLRYFVKPFAPLIKKGMKFYLNRCV